MAHQEVRGRRDVAAGTSSVPSWPVIPPVITSTLRAWYVIGAGDAALALCDAWRGQLIARGLDARQIARLQYEDTVDAVVPAGELLAALADEPNGVGIAIAGPEHVVLAVQRDALAAGAIPSEIVSHATERTRIRVYCPHCRGLGVHRAEAGSIVPCGSCGRRLSVRDHFSRRLAAYLGSDIDAGAIG